MSSLRVRSVRSLHGCLEAMTSSALHGRNPDGLHLTSVWQSHCWPSSQLAPDRAGEDHAQGWPEAITGDAITHLRVILPGFTPERRRMARFLRGPSNTNAGMRELFVCCGQPGLTSPIWRRTIAMIMEPGGLSAPAGAGPARPPPAGNPGKPLLGRRHALYGSCSGSRVCRFVTASPGSPLFTRSLHWFYDPRQGGPGGAENHR
jgi:hypothetical protein